MIESDEFIREATALARALGREWARNVLWHSFTSDRISKVKSRDQVALEAGNLPSVIFKHTANRPPMGRPLSGPEFRPQRDRERTLSDTPAAGRLETRTWARGLVTSYRRGKRNGW